MKHTWWSGWEFSALISKKLNVVSTCCHGYIRGRRVKSAKTIKTWHLAKVITSKRVKEKYLSGNLWRQEIKAPCWKNLKKNKREREAERSWEEKRETNLITHPQIFAGRRKRANGEACLSIDPAKSPLRLDTNRWTNCGTGRDVIAAFRSHWRETQLHYHFIMSAASKHEKQLIILNLTLQAAFASTVNNFCLSPQIFSIWSC